MPQEVQLFSGSVRENIRYGKLDASDCEIDAAALPGANADTNLLRGCRDRYETLVGRRGVKTFEAGRDGIAIARASLKDRAYYYSMKPHRGLGQI